MSNNKKILWPGWETVRLIGRGGFGSVYEIRRQIFNEVETAALKVISIPQNPSEITEMYNDGYDTESITETFRTHLKSIVSEYSLMRKMNGSANIVNCDDVRYIQHDNGIGWDIFIKMELLTPLAETLSSTISEATVVRIASDICEALVLCNKHEIIHRDIKPQNIFVSPNGDYKLGDFGIAKTVESTMSGTKIGTYKYMAPEVYNNQPYGSGADIYALGLVLYWLLNERRMPFMPPLPAKLTARVEEEARQRRFSGEEVPPPLHGSEKLKQIVLKACAYQPHERYVSAMDMLEDLDKLESDATLFPSGVVNTTDSMGLPNTTAQKNAVQEDRNTSRLIYSDVDNRYDNQEIEETIAVAKLPVNSEATVAVRKAKTNSAQKQHVSTAKTNKQVNGKKKKLVAIICVALAVIIAATFGILSFTHYLQSNDDNSGDATSSNQPQAVSLANCKHIWNPVTCTEPKTCSICGETAGIADGHIWLEATYDEPETCSVCFETRGEPLADSEESDKPVVGYSPLFIGKADTTPVVDGVVGTNEYTTTISYDATSEYWSIDSTDGAEAYNVTLYVSWDEKYLYTAVEIGPVKPRTYNNTDYLQNRPYIFDRRHVMTAIVPGNPTEPKYKAPNGEDWSWGKAYSSLLANEWTITAQSNGANISADHFGKLTQSSGFKYVVAVSQNKTEIYEQRIPWANLQDAAGFTPKAGATIGYAFMACCEEVDITVEEGEDEAAVYACFGSGVKNGKNFSKYVGLTLKD